MNPAALLLTLVVWLALIGPLPGADGPLNVVLLVSDDHNHRALGRAGNPVLRTPHLDRLAEEGVYFDHCFTPNPICTPSRACLFTGQDSWTNGVTFNGKAIREDSPLLPRLLAEAGHETAFVGKWHSDGLPWTRGYMTGGRCWAGGSFNHFDLDLTPFGQGPESRHKAERYSTDVFTDDAVAYLRSTPTRPFLLVVAYLVGHDPFLAPPGYEGRYRADEVPAPPNFLPQPPFEQFNPAIRDETVLPFPRDEASVREATAEYYAMMEHLDANVGRLLAALRETGRDRDTLVIFTSAKGLSLGSHGIIGKQTLYEEGIRIPLIVRHPNLRRVTATNQALVSSMDILPTICEATGIPVPDRVEGRSLLGLYSGEGDGQGSGEVRDKLFFSYHDPNRATVTRAIRTRTHKLVQHLVTCERQLFDLTADPFELVNLYGSPGSRAFQETLEGELKRWREGTPGK